MKINTESKSVIILLGYMGSGKTTVGQQLASSLSWVHVDLDDYIESNENWSISKIMNEKGAIYFRKQEKKYLEALLASSKQTVISLGGGTPCYHDNMKSIQEAPSCTSIYLRANVPFLTDRLFPEKNHRPLIASTTSKEDLASFIGKHLLERAAFYEMADFTVDIKGKSPEHIADEITRLG